MSAKAIYELTAKTILCNNLVESVYISNRHTFVGVNQSADWPSIEANNPWIHSEVM